MNQDGSSKFVVHKPYKDFLVEKRPNGRCLVTLMAWSDYMPQRFVSIVLTREELAELRDFLSRELLAGEAEGE